MKKKTIKELLSSLDHVGAMVTDMDMAIEFYENLGFGPFNALNVTIINRKVRGKLAPDVENLARICPVGPIGFELIQAISGKSIQQEFIENKGEGINHLAFRIDDLDEAIEIMTDAGFRVVSSGETVGGGGYAYFDTDRIGGIQIELFEIPPTIDRLWGN